MSDETGLEMLARTLGRPALGGPEELLLYMQALLTVAAGDGYISADERSWVLTYAFDQGVEDADLERLRSWTSEGSSLSELLSAMDPTGLPDELLALRRALLFDAMRAAGADGVFDSDERAAIYSVAGTMGITAEDIKALEAKFSEV